MDKEGGQLMNGRDFYTGSKIYWRKNRGKWQGILYYKDDNGKQRQKGIMLTPKKRESQEMFEKIKAELNEQMRINPNVSEAIPMSSKTVRDRVGDYLRYLESVVAMGNLELTTYTNKRFCAETYIFREPIADVPYERLSKEDVIEWITSVMGRGISANTIKTPLGVLRQTYKWDIEQGKIKSSPLAYVKTPKWEVKPVNYATDRTLKNLMPLIEKKYQNKRQRKPAVGFMLALYMGMRSEEICGIRWKDVNFTTYDWVFPDGRKMGKHEGYISITNVIARNKGKAYAKPPKTSSSTRKLPMPKEIEDVLLDYMDKTREEYGVDELEPNWYVLGNKDRFYNPNDLGAAFTRLAKKHQLIGSEGRTVTLHGLRDTHATLAVQSKAVDIKTLSAIMGHADVATTLRMYTGYGDERVKRDSVNTVAQVINRKSWVNPNATGKARL